MIGQTPRPYEIRSQVRAALRSQLGDAVDGVGDDEQLRDALAERYDSLGALECITRVESEFGIEVDFVTHDVRYWFATIERMVQFVADRLEDKAALEATP